MTRVSSAEDSRRGAASGPNARPLGLTGVQPPSSGGSVRLGGNHGGGYGNMKSNGSYGGGNKGGGHSSKPKSIEIEVSAGGSSTGYRK